MIAGPKAHFPALAIAVLSLAACAHPVAPPTYNKTVLAGQTIQIDFVAILNPDCTIRSLPVVRMTTLPAHGTTEVKEAQDFTSFPTANARSACNKVKSKGIGITYTPSPGYYGNDYLSYETINSDGLDKTFETAITVK